MHSLSFGHWPNYILAYKKIYEQYFNIFVSFIKCLLAKYVSNITGVFMWKKMCLCVLNYPGFTQKYHYLFIFEHVLKLVPQLGLSVLCWTAIRLKCSIHDFQIQNINITKINKQRPGLAHFKKKSIGQFLRLISKCTFTIIPNELGQKIEHKKWN